MKLTIHILEFLFIAFALTFLSLLISFTLPFPFQSLNIPFALLIVALVAWNKGIVVLISFASNLLLEPYVTTPFGVRVSSATLGMLVAVWLYQGLFTNRSWYAVFFLTGVSLGIERMLYAIFLFAAHRFSPQTPWWGADALVKESLWQIGLTAVFAGIAYWVLSRIISSLRSSEIRA